MGDLADLAGRIHRTISHMLEDEGAILERRLYEAGILELAEVRAVPVDQYTEAGSQMFDLKVELVQVGVSE